MQSRAPEILARLRKGEPGADIARSLGCSRAYVSYLKINKLDHEPIVVELHKDVAAAVRVRSVGRGTGKLIAKLVTNIVDDDLFNAVLGE